MLSLYAEVGLNKYGLNYNLNSPKTFNLWIKVTESLLKLCMTKIHPCSHLQNLHWAVPPEADHTNLVAVSLWHLEWNDVHILEVGWSGVQESWEPEH